MGSKLFILTVTGLNVRSDWRAVHDRMLDEFPGVLDVLATTMPGTILIVHTDPSDVDAWLDTVTATILDRRRARDLQPRAS